ncbi:hypothetical protein ACTFIY_008371 [Dictyostelium cf. discoideum]
MPHLMHFSPTYCTPSKIMESPSKLLNTPKKIQVQTPSSTNKAPAKPNFSEFGQKKNKITMEEDISNFNQVILRQSNKSKNLKNKTEQHHNEQSKDQLEDQINKSLQKVDKSTSIKTIMNNTIRIGVWNVQGSNTTQSSSIINTVLDNNRTKRAQIIMNTQIKTTTKTINERIITSEWIIAKILFQCTTIYAPAKSNNTIYIF